ncbi:hypothetical protein KSS87_020281 [Heliosperma pusillum]|nr:hypothetical protein KSS87_020281 [Heliosperma pusillum]
MAVGSVRYRGPRRKSNKVSFRTVYRVILGHPFIVATLLYLIILHRYFPFLFSLLLSAAPVLVCTALLLGTLLFHGQQNDFKVGNREERNNGPESLNSSAVEYASPVDKDGNFSKEICGEVRNDIVERPLISYRGFIGSDQEYDNARLNLSSNQIEKSKPGFNFAKFDIQNIPRHKLHPQDSDEKYDKTINSQLDAVMQEQSDSSFDALVADVLPTPQETHPLLELEDPLQSQTFGKGNHEAGRESEGQSLDSNHSSEDSDDDSDYKDEEEGENGKNIDDPNRKNGDSQSPFEWTDDDQRIIQELRSSEIEKNEHLESLISRAEDDGSEEREDEDDVASIDDVDDDVDADVDVDDDEDENLDVVSDGSKHVTLWTEEDEKNLRHLGCSELERNLRLENLLARRRAKRNFSMISERNLIDLDHSEHPFPIAPISTTRVNPFDVTNDTSHHPSVPPIPSSAPSVTLPRKNPFDSPCTSPKREQNPHRNGSSTTGYNTTSNALKPEFGDINRKEALFRRYDSFSTGYNLIGDPSTHDSMGADRRDFVLRRHETFNTRSVFPSFFSSKRPVFVPERVAGEVRHCSLERQSSRDSESVYTSDAASSSHEYDKRDQEIDETIEDHHDSNAPPNEGMSSDCESSVATESLFDDQDEHFPESVEVSLDQIYQQEVLHESHENSDDTSSSSSEHVECSLNESQIEDHAECSLNESRIDEHVECSVNKSRIEEHVEGLENERQIEDEQVEGSGFSSKDLNISEASHMGIDDDNHHVDPVYDTSPSSVEKSTAFVHSTQV